VRFFPTSSYHLFHGLSNISRQACDGPSSAIPDPPLSVDRPYTTKGRQPTRNPYTRPLSLVPPNPLWTRSQKDRTIPRSSRTELAILAPHSRIRHCTSQSIAQSESPPPLVLLSFRGTTPSGPISRAAIWKMPIPVLSSKGDFFSN